MQAFAGDYSARAYPVSRRGDNDAMSEPGLFRQLRAVFPAVVVAVMLHCAPAGAVGATAAPAFSPSVAAWSEAAGLDAREVSAIAVPLDGHEPLIAHQPQRVLSPASTIKIVTTWAALSLLGPQFRWQTAFHLRGTLADGVLHGDLVVRGGGDPKLVIEHLEEIIAGLRAAGLERIEGDLVLDDSIFEAAWQDPADFDGRPWQPYNVLPSGVLLNFKSSRLIARPVGGQVEFAFDPPLDGVAIENFVRVVSGPCRYGVAALHVSDEYRVDAGEADMGRADGHRADGPARTGPHRGDVVGPDIGRHQADVRSSEPPRVRVSGAYSRACGVQDEFVSVLDHRAFAGALFGAAWKAAGGQWHGHARIERGAAQGEPWFVWTSPHTLADVVHDINKRSNNVMTRQLLLQLAAQAGEKPATLAGARALLRDWLRRQEVDLPAIVVDNGSGLSRTARASAADLTAILRGAAHGSQAELLRESLPLVGIDGTMKARFSGEALVGQAWIKTGSLRHVRAIAGYVRAASGRMYAVALMVNGERASSSRPVQDAFLRWVHEHG